MMGIEFRGLDQVKKKLNDIKERAEELNGNHTVSFSELFNHEFMAEYSQYQSMQELMDKSGFTINNQEDFAAIPDDQWDEYIRKVTKFENWKEMQQTAASKWAAKKMGV